LFEEYEEQIENEEDLEKISTKLINQAVVSGSDWTSETILNQIKKGNINLNPDFQRRIAWNDKKKSKFIESLILGYPIPQLVFAEKKDSRP